MMRYSLEYVQYIYAVVAEYHMDLAYGHYVQRIGFEVFIYKTRCEKVEKNIQHGISWSQFVAEIALIQIPKTIKTVNKNTKHKNYLPNSS